MKNFIQKIKSNPPSKVIPLLFLPLAVFIFAINYQTITTDNYYNPKSLALGIISFFISVALIIFPGSKRKINEYPGENVSLPVFWAESPKLHRIAWIAALAIASIIYFVADSYLAG